MFKKTLILIIALLPAVTWAKPLGDSELSSLVDIVVMLRGGDEAAFARALSILQSDAKWTPMNELGPLSAAECRPPAAGSFKLNRLLTRAERERKYVDTHGDMLNGEDARYNYSLYERTLKPSSTANYTLNKRFGKQTFVIVPYDGDLSGIEVKINGQPVSPITDTANKALIVSVKRDKSDDSPLSLSLTNSASSPRSFAIINHNSRK